MALHKHKKATAKKSVQHGRKATSVPQSAPPPAGMPPGGKKKGKK